MAVECAEGDLLSSTAGDYTVEVRITENIYNHFYAHRRKLIRDHQGSTATAFKCYLMKKIPKLLLEHDKEYNKYDIYFLNKDEDNKIDKKTVFGDK